MKLTLVLSDLRWLAELRDRQLLGRGGVQIPEIDKRKLLAMGLIEEKTCLMTHGTENSQILGCLGL
jgi:hypothetical protein